MSLVSEELPTCACMPSFEILSVRTGDNTCLSLHPRGHLAEVFRKIHGTLPRFMKMDVEKVTKRTGIYLLGIAQQLVVEGSGICI
ncbi:hypothetical protein [Pseudomonas sp. ICMP 561]|uniref:hypothetical protein n=1 Tax=Pseudomonas sp. ICMP 561 TaxID=1718918 RepID=UPI00359C289A